MKRFVKIFIIIISIAIVFIFCVGTILPPYKGFSKIENRSYFIPSVDILSIEKIKSGELFKAMDKTFEDQLYKREKLVELYTWIQYKLGKDKINDKVLGSDNYSFIVHYPQIMDGHINNLNDLGNYCSEKGIRTFYTLIPTSDLINIDKIPNYYKNDSSFVFEQMKNRLNKNINYINLYQTMKNANKTQQQYYKSDHHWNTNGVFTAYSEIINKINKVTPEIGQPYTKNDFDFKNYNNIFLGSSGRVLTTSVVKEYDDISLFYPKFKSDIKVKTNELNNYPVYHMDFISKDPYNNDYGVYLAGAEMDLSITNLSAKSNKTAVVVGVSFAPPLTLLLAEHYSQIDYIDLRYTNRKDLYSLIDEKNPDNVIFLYYSGEFNDTLYTFKK